MTRIEKKRGGVPSPIFTVENHWAEHAPARWRYMAAIYLVRITICADIDSIVVSVKDVFAVGRMNHGQVQSIDPARESVVLRNL